jgi:hypothetical protein
MHIKTPDIVEEVITIVENQLQALSDNQKLVLREWLTSAVDHHLQEAITNELLQAGNEAIEKLEEVFGTSRSTEDEE